MKTYTLFLLILVLFFACSDDDTSPKKVTVVVPITILDVDNTGTIGEELEMRVRATGYNGCYSDLEILLEESDERHYTLSASATLTKSNVCTENLVIQDTVITFTPPQTGSYYFSANQPDLPILRDTLVVE